MAHKVTYKVHSLTEQSLSRQVDFEGAKMAALITGLCVELIGSEDHSVTFSWVPKDIEKAKAEFAVGRTVSGTFSAIADAPAADKE